MASSSSPDQRNQEFNAFSGIESAGERRMASESSTLYDVFINHRGSDVKLTLATQFYNSLRDLHIRAFLDSEEKELGDSFPSTIETAIRSAKVHIAIFSKRYAESPWCLAELVLMSESKAKIIPVFYEVKPSDLRHIENGTYAHAFLKYKEKGRYLEKLNTWKEALKSISFIAGEEFNSHWQCQKIVEAVQKEVQRKTCICVAEYPVGLNNLVEDFERRSLDGLVEDIENKCKLKKLKDTMKMVGIFGMGGLGKTTLAKELFNRKKSLYLYNKSSFLFDVREADVTNQLPCLQRKLLQDLFNKDLSFRSIEEGISYLKDHLERSPLLNSLIVVDDIDHVKQLNALLVMDIFKKSNNCLIIVTTRDEGVLITAGITNRYNLKGMDRNDGRELFCRHAFDQPHPSSEYEVLVNDFVTVCRGLPLSLQVLGRHVRGRTKDYWHSELIKVSKMLHRDVKQSLRISFESLDDEEKQVFMDVACFFVGKQTDVAQKILEATGWNARNALQTLKDKCLLEKDVFRYGLPELRMHDHLRDLGREMALELNLPHRLWRPQDLKSLESVGFQTILAQPNVRCFHSIFDESMAFQITFFLGQSNNRFEKSGSLLWLELEGDFSWIHHQNLQYFPRLRQSDVQYFPRLRESDVQAPSHLKETRKFGEVPIIPSWFPLQNLHSLKIKVGRLKSLWRNQVQLKEIQKFRELPSIPSWIPLQNLQCLKIKGGQLNSLWRNYVQAPSQLKKLQISQTSLREFPELLGISKDSLENGENSSSVSVPVSGLEELEIDISGEKFVSKILISGIHYPSLKSIKLCGMENLMEVNLTRVNTLICLNFINCKKLRRLAATSDLSNLALLNISQCPVLGSVTIVDCEHSKSMTGISDLMSSNYLYSKSGLFSVMMQAELNISKCPQLDELRLGHLSRLEKITIENCNHLRSVSGISNIASLVQMEISNCSKLVFENLILSGMKCLEMVTFDRKIKVKYLELDTCQKLKTIKFGCGELVELSIRGCPKLVELPAFRGSCCLERIIIDGCGKFKCLQLDGCQNLRSVSANFESSWLGISHSPKLKELSDLATLSLLEEIEIRHCEKIQNIMLPTTLISLCVESCRDLQRIEGTGDLTNLVKLIIKKCPALEELPSLDRVRYSEEIEIRHCEKIQKIMLPTTLISLCVESCRDLQRIEGTGDLTDLAKLIIKKCPALEELPSLDRVRYSEEIEIRYCEKIQNIMLPTTLISLCVESCRDLQRIEGTGDLTNLAKLTIKKCPALEELPNLDRVRYSEEIEISHCEKIQNIMLPTTLISLCVESCRDLQRIEGTGDHTNIAKLIIKKCPALEELPNLDRVRYLEEIEIGSCEMLQNIVLPRTFIYLSIQSCRSSQIAAVVDGLTDLKRLIFKQCHELDELPSLAGMGHLEEILIDSCDKLQNIMLPTILISLSVQSCRDLRKIEGTGDLTKLSKLIIKQCPVLEELPCLARASCLEEIEIGSCKPLEKIMLPTTLISLSLHKCRDLQRIAIAGTGDLTKLTKVMIKQCPALEELPSHAGMRCLEEIVIDSCEKLQNITGIEDSHVSGWMILRHCRNAMIRNCINKLKNVPSEVMYMIGRAANGAKSSLNRDLFSDANIGVDVVSEIAVDKADLEWYFRSSFKWSELSAVIVCFVVVVDSSTSIEDINQTFPYPNAHEYAEAWPKEREGEWIITMVARDWRHLFQFRKIEDALRRNRILMKSFRVEVKDGEEWKSICVLRTIVNTLYH